MTIRKLTLEEWFLDYQLRSVDRDHFHLPFTVDVPLAPLTEPWESRGLRTPMPALLVRAVAVLATRRPEMNRMLFRTPLGPRMVCFEGQHVNVPVVVRHEGRDFLSAVTVRDASSRTVEDIAAQLRAARDRPMAELRVNQMFLDGKNTFWRRCKLRALHFFSYRFPWTYVKAGAGGLAVSSLWHRRRDTLVTRGVAMGPNAVTFFLCSTSGEGADAVLHLGAAFDHCVLGGDTFLSIMGDLTDLLADPVAAGLVPAEQGNA